MRELKAKYGLKGIALSGFGHEADRIRSLDAGFVLHLTVREKVKRRDRKKEREREIV